MIPSVYSLQVAQTAQSGATGSTTVPFVNNAELILGSPNTSLDGGGITGANPNATTDASAAPTLSTAAAAANASGQSAIVWVSVAGILVAILIALKGKM